jgi:hypothetical protein
LTRELRGCRIDIQSYILIGGKQYRFLKGDPDTFT